MMHTYRATTVFQHWDSQFPQEDFLEEWEWASARLTARSWKNVLLGLQLFGPELVSQEGIVKTTIYRDDAEIGKLFFLTWECFGTRKFAFHFRDRNHGITTIRVFEEE